MAEAFERKFTGWVLAGAGVLAVAGIGATVNMSIAMARLETAFVAFQTNTLSAITELRASVSAMSQDRYTGANATTDRTAYLSTFTDALDRVNRTHISEYQALTSMVVKNDERDLAQDVLIQALLTFKARVEERDRIQEKQP